MFTSESILLLQSVSMLQLRRAFYHIMMNQISSIPSTNLVISLSAYLEMCFANV